jgi:hypothetical protein
MSIRVPYTPSRPRFFGDKIVAMPNLKWMFLLPLITGMIATAAVAQNLESDYVMESRLLENELERYLEARDREREAIGRVRQVAAELDETLADPNAPVTEMRRLDVILESARETAILRLEETADARARMYERMDKLAQLGSEMESMQPEPVREAEADTGPNGLWKFHFHRVDVHALVDLSFQVGGLDRTWMVVGTYRTSNGHRGNVRGNFRANRLELEVVDSRRGAIAYLDGLVSSSGTLKGTWQAIESGLDPDRPEGGAWTAQRVASDSELELD